jgi:hypothetical protein
MCGNAREHPCELDKAPWPAIGLGTDGAPVGGGDASIGTITRRELVATA